MCEPEVAALLCGELEESEKRCLRELEGLFYLELWW